MSEQRHVVRLEFPSLPTMVDLVAAAGTAVGRHLGLDDDSVHWINLALHEAVVNAIEHGNRVEASKPVAVEFVMVTGESSSELVLKVRDSGAGFDPTAVPDPRAPENLSRGGGRGIFFMRSVMDDVQISSGNGGTEVRMVKRWPRARGGAENG